MFVSSPSSIQSVYPAKPKPISPISTFVQSQSCMNLRIDLHDHQEHGLVGGIWLQNSGGCDEKALLASLAMSKEIYKSPLQRLGEALKLPQSGNALTRALAAHDAPVARGRELPRPPVKQPPCQDSPMRQPDNHSHCLVSGGSSAPTPTEPIESTAMDSCQQLRAPKQLNNNLKPRPRPPVDSHRNNNYFSSPDLLSSLSSNPRTRAPFKPQKSNRGTSSWQLKQYAEATLGSGSLRKAVKLPEGEDKDEWLAVNSGCSCLNSGS
jgi:MOB kinase activator 1